METRSKPYWWVPVVLGALFIAMTAVGYFDPVQSARNSYSVLELYAEVPNPHTVWSWIRLFLGLVGIMTVATIELAFGKRHGFRALDGPLHFVLFVMVCVGFVLVSITAARELSMLPDFAHYFYARGGLYRDAAALVQFASPLDREDWFFTAGSGLYILYLSFEGLRAKWFNRFTGIIGLLYAVMLVLNLTLNRLDWGTLSGMVGTFITGILTPVWMVSISLSIRRQVRNESITR